MKTPAVSRVPSGRASLEVDPCVAASPIGMTLAERVLCHQIHPLKLFTDVSTAFVAAWLLWAQKFGEAMLVGFVPSILG